MLCPHNQFHEECNNSFVIWLFAWSHKKKSLVFFYFVIIHFLSLVGLSHKKRVWYCRRMNIHAALEEWDLKGCKAYHLSFLFFILEIEKWLNNIKVMYWIANPRKNGSNLSLAYFQFYRSFRSVAPIYYLRKIKNFDQLLYLAAICDTNSASNKRLNACGLMARPWFQTLRLFFLEDKKQDK
jgi:hypothetical protein